MQEALRVTPVSIFSAIIYGQPEPKASYQITRRPLFRNGQMVRKADGSPFMLTMKHVPKGKDGKPPPSEEWRRAIETVVQNELRNGFQMVRKPQTVTLIAVFYRKRPTGKPKKQGNRQDTKPDMDNMLKLFSDVGTNKLFEDDSQVDCYGHPDFGFTRKQFTMAQPRLELTLFVTPSDMIDHEGLI